VKRVVVALLVPVTWAPPGLSVETWRAALAEDVVDLLAPLAEVSPAIAVAEADRSLADAVSWPSMPVYVLSEPSLLAALAAATAAGADQAAVICADAPDLPALLIGKLLRPLSTRPVAVAPAVGGGLLGLAARLPVPEWVVEVDANRTSPADLVAAAPRANLVGQAPAWHRLRGPDDLRRLDPALEGWSTTRSLLS
jgi:2-phospho-L-lactate guanylyltransferase (CobY/MobA/RfbA family)